MTFANVARGKNILYRVLLSMSNILFQKSVSTQNIIQALHPLCIGGYRGAEGGNIWHLGTANKPRLQVRGEGVAQMSTLLNKTYLVKVSTAYEGGGGRKYSKFCLRGLYTAPFFIDLSWEYQILYLFVFLNKKNIMLQ